MYPQSMFLSKNKKNNVYPCKPQFNYIKVGFKGVKSIYVYGMSRNASRNARRINRLGPVSIKTTGRYLRTGFYGHHQTLQITNNFELPTF